MEKRQWAALCLAGCLMLGLGACGSQTEQGSGSSSGSAEASTPTGSGSGAESASSQGQDALAEYTVEGVGTFQLPQGFAQETGEISQPLPMRYVTFQKDEYYIQANRFGTDAYEAAGVPLPADVEEYSTRSGVQDAVPEGTQFAYDSYGSYAAQFTQEDGQLCYYVLLQGENSFGNIFLTAPEGVFDPEEAALWLSGSVLE